VTVVAGGGRSSKAACFRAGACAASPRWRGVSRPFPFCLLTGLGSVHVRPIKADENEEKTMTTIEFTLLIDAFARLAAALAVFVAAFRRRR